MRPRASNLAWGVTALLTFVLVLPAVQAAQIGTSGNIAGSATAGLAGNLVAFGGAPAIVYRDNGATAGSLDSTEGVFLDINGDSEVDINDVVLSSTGGPSTAGSQVTSAITTSIATTTGGNALSSLLRFKDSLPALADGGPDGAFNPGEILFIDVNNDALLGTNDVVLSGGTPGARQSSADTDSIWHAADECIYSGTATGAVVTAGQRRITVCGAFLEGTVVAGGDADEGDALLSYSGIAITGGDASMATGEDAYVDSTPVSSGAYRLTATGAGAAGSVVDCVTSTGHAADADCAAVLTSVSTTYVTRTSSSYPALALPSIAWSDRNGDDAYTGGDRVYFDFDGNAFATPADVRVSPTTVTYGSRPVLGDLDARAVLETALNTAAAIWNDADGDGVLDTTEAVAIDLDGDIHLDFGDVPVFAGAGCTVGAARRGTTTCGASGTWKDVTAASPVGALMVHDEAPAGPSRGDGIYVHLGAGTTVTAGDVRITESIIGGTAVAGGARVAAGAVDVGASLAAAVLGTDFEFNTFDTDGSQTRTPQDLLYVDIGAGDGLAEVRDARLHNTLTFGEFLSEVVSTDKDTILLFTDVAAAPANLVNFIDLDGNTVRSLGDPIHLRTSSSVACGTVGGTDVHASAGMGSKAAGTTIGSGNDAGLTCIDIAGATFAYSPTTEPYSSSSAVYLDLGNDGAVSIGDVAITGSTPGAKIGSGNSNLNTALTAIAATALLKFLDLSGDGTLDSGDPIVLDKDSDGYYSAGDLLVTGTGGTTSLTASSSGGGGGGGGSTVDTSTATTSTTTTDSTSTSSTNSTTNSTTSSTSTTGEPVPGDIAAANLAIAASLKVERKDGENTLTWDTQPGVDGYQVFSSESPFVLVTTLQGQDQSTYTDPNGGKGTKYLVTAYLAGDELTADDVNNGDVPGYSEVPEGEKAKTGGKGFIPAPGLVFVTLALAGLVLALRRRLD